MQLTVSGRKARLLLIRCFSVVLCLQISLATACYAQESAIETAPAVPPPPVEVAPSSAPAPLPAVQEHTVVDVSGHPDGILSVTGDFNNTGTLYLVSTNPNITNATISAQNIINAPNALITTILPQGGLALYPNAIAQLSLTLQAVANITNYGTISSANNLAMTAGGTISNIVGTAGTMPIISATNDIAMQASSIVNAGQITSQLGNINIMADVIRNEGTLQAMIGNINVGSLLNTQLSVTNSGTMSAGNSLQFVLDNVMSDLKPSLDVTGGVLAGTNQILFQNASGKVNVDIKDVLGPVDIIACEANLAVSDGSSGLNLRTFDISGDPNITYTGSGPYTSGAVSTDGGFVMIDTSADTINGSITFTGAITTTPSLAGNGGNVTLLAGTTINTGTITTSPSGSNNSAGSITLVAPGAISTGDLNAGAANNGNGGNIVLDSGNATFSVGSIVTRSGSCNTCAITAFSPGFTGTGTSGTLDFRQNGVTLVNPTISFAAGSNIVLDGTNAGRVVEFTMGNANALGTILASARGANNGGRVNITSPFALTINGDISTEGVFGGGVNLDSAGALSTRGIYTTATNGVAGNITLHAGTTLQAAELIAAGSNNSSGGNITLDSNTGSFTLSTLNTRSTSYNGPANNSATYNDSFTGSGTMGTIEFKQNGVNLANPTLSFGANSSIVMDGRRGGATNQALNFTMGNSNFLDSIVTTNQGSGGTAGSVNIQSPFDLTIQRIYATGTNGNDVTLTSTGNVTTPSVFTYGNSTRAGDISVIAGGAITATGGGLVAGGSLNANGGNISLQSGTSTFTLSDVITRSTSYGGPVNNSATFNGSFIGAGSAGSLTFKDGTGATIANPTVSFTPGASIVVDGRSAGTTTGINLTLGNANALYSVMTGNNGPGTAGSINLTGPGDIAITQMWAMGGTGGNVTVSAPAGSITVNQIYTTGTAVRAGDILLDAAGSVTSPNLNAIGILNASGGNITVDSGTATFFLGDLHTRSTSYSGPSNPATYSNVWTGAGTAGALTLMQNGAPLLNPTVNFYSGASILVDGRRVTPNQSLSFQLANANALGVINTSNPIGTAGNINIYAAPASNVTIQSIYASGVNGGNVDVRSPAGNLTIQQETATWSAGAGGLAGTVNYTAQGTISTGDIYAVGLNSANGNNIILDGSGVFSTGSLMTRSTSYSDPTNANTLSNLWTGLGNAGTLTFLQGGVAVPNPTINFRAGSSVLVDGRNAGGTQSLEFTTGNSNALYTVNTSSNAGPGANPGTITIHANGNAFSATDLFATGSSGANISVTGASTITIGRLAQATASGGTGGSITLQASGLIDTSTAVVTTTGFNNSNGGTITFDSGSSTFNIGSLQTRSTSYTDPFNGVTFTNVWTGTGTAGALSFRSNGVILANPTVAFTNNAYVLLDGSNGATAPAFGVNFANGNTISILNTSNRTGNSGLININSASPVTITQLYAVGNTGGTARINSAGTITLGAPLNNYVRLGSTSDLTLIAPSFDLQGTLSGGTVRIIPTGAGIYNADLAMLTRINASTLQIGQQLIFGTTRPIIVLGSNTLTNITQNFILDTAGAIDSSGVTIATAPTTNVRFTSGTSSTIGSISTGTITGANSVTLNTFGSTTLLGPISVVTGGFVDVYGSTIDLQTNTIAAPNGTVRLLPQGTPAMSIAAPTLLQITARDLRIGQQLTYNTQPAITLTGAANLSTIANSFIIDTLGSIDASAAAITVPSSTEVRYISGTAASPGSISSGVISGARYIQLNTFGATTVSGALAAINGATVDVYGSAINVPNSITASGGTVRLLPQGSAFTTIDLSQLPQVTAANLRIGQQTGIGTTADIIMQGNATLTGLTSSFIVDTNGAIMASGSTVDIPTTVQLQHLSGAGNITTGSITGTSNIIVNGRATTTIDGPISTLTATNVDVYGASIIVNSPIVAPNSAIRFFPNNTASTTISAADLGRITGASLRIGQQAGFNTTSDITITGTGGPTVGAFSVDTAGSYSGTGSTLNFGNSTPVSINTGNFASQRGLSSGNITAGTISLTGSGATTVDGALNAANTLTVRSDFQTLSIAPGVSAISGGDMVLSGATGVNIGAPAGAAVNIAAGRLAAPYIGTSSLLPANSVVSPGAVSITNFTGAAVTDINIGDDVNISSAGDGALLDIQSRGDVIANNNLRLTSWGGNISLRAGDDIILGSNAQLNAIAKVDNAGGTTVLSSGATVPTYTGGGIALLAGLPTSDPNALLNGLVNQRTAQSKLDTPVGYNTGTNVWNISGGTYAKVELPLAGSDKDSMVGNIFNSSGGVLLLDPPDPGNLLVFSGATFSAVAPRLGDVFLGAPAPTTTPPIVAAPLPVAESVPFLVVDLPTAASITNPNGTASPRDSTQVSLQVPETVTNARADNSCITRHNLSDDANSGAEFVVTTGSCAAVSTRGSANRSTTMLAAPGTQMTHNEQNDLKLRRGKVLVMTESKQNVVDTNGIMVKFDGGSAGLIERSENGVLRAAALSGSGLTLVTADGKTISVKAGEEIALAEGDEEELIAADGVGRTLIESSIVKLGPTSKRMVIARSKFDHEGMAKKCAMLNCPVGCLAPTEVRLLKELQTTLSPKNKAQTPAPGPHVLKPVAYKPALPAAPAHQIFANDQMYVCYESASTVKAADGRVDLGSGEMVVHSKKRIVVSTKYGEIQVPAGCTLAIRSDATCDRINCVDGAGATVKGPKRDVHLIAGQEAIISNTAVSHKVTSDGVARRNVQVHQWDNTKDVVTSEASFISLCANNGLLRRLINSQNDSERKIADAVVKTNVALGVVTARHGAFRTNK